MGGGLLYIYIVSDKIKIMNKIKFSQKHINQFKKLGVEIVYVFGSRALGKFITSLSDVDFGIVFRKGKVVRNVKEEELFDALFEEIDKIIAEGDYE